MKNKRMMPDEGWVPIANSTAQSRRLSWRAKGLLADLLSFPDGYDITFDRLIAMAKAAGDPDVEGRDAMRRAMQELERKGYVAHVRHAMKDEDTKRVFWRTETVVCDLPGIVNVRGTGIQEPGGPGGRLSSTTEGQELSNNTVTYKNGDQDELANSTSSLASAREGQQASKQDRRAALERVWDIVDRLSEQQLRNALLDFERKRRTIYRDCRQSAIGQFERGEGRILKGESRGLATDRLSYKYGIQHYDGKLPSWITKHLRNAA